MLQLECAVLWQQDPRDGTAFPAHSWVQASSAWSPERVSTNISRTCDPTELSMADSAPEAARRPAVRGSTDASVSTRTAT